MTKLQAIREFAQMIHGGHVTINRTRFDEGNWGMDIDNSDPGLITPKDFTYMDEKDKAFRADFIARCPLATDFSDVTLTILHEFGHWYNRKAMNIVVYDEMVKSDDNYLANPYEVLATQWAICWLLCPVNRKIAKDFEKKFFGRSE